MAEGSIPAAVYYRMSDDRQEDSIDRQRSQVEPYAAKHGYRIVAEYVEPGISGFEITNRPQFQCLLRDAKKGGPFRAILCDDQDRFGRFDSIDLGEVVAPLRRAGIWLDTVAQGRQDWNTFTGRLSGLVMQETRDQEHQAISRRVLSEMLRKAKEGKFLGGPIPYGFVAVPDPDFGKRLVPDGRKAEVVRLIFRLYAEGHSLQAISLELWRRGQPSPTGKDRWSRQAVRVILKNRKYTGDLPWGVHRFGKRFRLTGGQVEATRRDEQRYSRNPEGDWIVRPATHEGLVSREVFEAVQARLTQGRQRWLDGERTPLVNGGPFVLTRLLVCSHCGGYMLGGTRRGRRVYVCGTYHEYGVGHCHKNTIHERPLVELLLRKLQETFLDPDNLSALRREVAEVQDALRGDENRDGLRKELGALEAKIRKANETLLFLDRDRLAGAQEALRGLERQRDDVKRELSRLDTAEPPTEALERLIAGVEDALWQLQQALTDEDVPLLRQTLRQLVSRVEMQWKHKTTGKRTRSKLVGGAIYYRPQEGVSLEVSSLSTAVRHCCRR
jgi:site-specific DNA recombinase